MTLLVTFRPSRDRIDFFHLAPSLRETPLSAFLRRDATRRDDLRALLSFPVLSPFARQLPRRWPAPRTVSALSSVAKHVVSSGPPPRFSFTLLAL